MKSLYNMQIIDSNNKLLLSYNLLMNKNWLMIIPRSKEKAFDKFSVNSMGFSASILLKNE